MTEKRLPVKIQIKRQGTVLYEQYAHPDVRMMTINPAGEDIFYAEGDTIVIPRSVEVDEITVTW